LASTQVKSPAPASTVAVERYGTSHRAAWRIADLKLGEQRTSWSVLRDGKLWADFEFPLGGEYNVWNATAAAALATHHGISKDAIASALASFCSVKRRLEVKAEVNGITIIDDFAHHPTAIEQTILALRARYPQSPLWVILEPRSNTMRRNVLQDALARSLSLADQVVVAAIFKSEAIPEAERLDLSRVIADVQQRGKQARVLADADAIVSTIAPELRERDVVAILSNGGFGGIYEKLPQRLRELKSAGVKSLGVKS
jgi:UDP-N-acetylmuramate: L-alanyl-gamma-D-glutamyl-meso-diaminopimelate ligase